MFVTKYVETKGVLQKLVADASGKPVDNARSFKYTPDPSSISQNNGNDIPFIRYADILLNRAEALNELDGSNQESLDLIKQVRQRAGLGNMQLADFATTEILRTHLLKERGWEFSLKGSVVRI